MLMAGGVWACMPDGNTLAHGNLLAPDSCQAYMGSGSHHVPVLSLLLVVRAVACMCVCIVLRFEICSTPVAWYLCVSRGVSL